MPPLVTRLVCGIGLVATLPTLFLISGAIIGRWIGADQQVVVSFIAFFSLAFVWGWLRVWTGVIAWTPSRSYWTWIALAASATVGCGVYLVFTRFPRGMMWKETGAVFAGMVVCLTWIFTSTFAWRETKAERAARLSGRGDRLLPCPKCGYNLTGLRETRCPECGATYTLDELVGALVEQRAPLSSD